MTAPWMEIEKYQDPDLPLGQGYPDFAWQARFAGQVEIRSHLEWAKLRWGFNAAALLDEALERQKVFLESQYNYPDELGLETTDHRTIALRFINRPGEGLLVAVVGKVHAPTEAEVTENAASYLKELKSTIPYDYALTPAFSQTEFMRYAGEDLLDWGNNLLCVAQIKRLEFSPDLKRDTPFLQGFWRSSPHAHEQVWRSLATSSAPVLLNISLRSTALYESERAYLLSSIDEISKMDNRSTDQFTASARKQWSKHTLERRLAPWKKHFYLQVHLASTQKLSEDLFRTIGTALALNNKSDYLTGYEVVVPKPQKASYWQKKLKNLDIILSDIYLQHPRLAEVADLEEVFDVMRLPYAPPDEGFPDMKFVTTVAKQ